MINKESRLDSAFQAVFLAYRRLPEGLQSSAPFILFAALEGLAFLISRGRNTSTWVVFMALLAFCLPAYLLLMWIVGAALDGEGFRLIGLQRDKKDLRSLHWRQFERLVANLFRAEEYRVTPRGGPRRDGGKDAEISKDGKKWIVQIKHWPNESFFVQVTHVRELLGVVTKEGATGGVFVTSGLFSEPAVDFALGTSIELVDGEAFWARLAKAQVALDPNRALVAPRCGFCNTLMAMREEGTLWVCLDPECGATKPVRKEGWLSSPTA